MNKRIMLPMFLLAMMFVGMTFASSTTTPTTSNSLTTVVCKAWNTAFVDPGYETSIEGVIIVISFLIIGYESFQRVHMKHLSTKECTVDDNELATVMSHSMSIIIVMGIILVAIVGSFTVMTNMVC